MNQARPSSSTSSSIMKSPRPSASSIIRAPASVTAGSGSTDRTRWPRNPSGSSSAPADGRSSAGPCPRRRARTPPDPHRRSTGCTSTQSTARPDAPQLGGGPHLDRVALGQPPVTLPGASAGLTIHGGRGTGRHDRPRGHGRRSRERRGPRALRRQLEPLVESEPSTLAGRPRHDQAGTSRPTGSRPRRRRRRAPAPSGCRASRRAADLVDRPGHVGLGRVDPVQADPGVVRDAGSRPGPRECVHLDAVLEEAPDRLDGRERLGEADEDLIGRSSRGSAPG